MLTISPSLKLNSLWSSTTLTLFFVLFFFICSPSLSSFYQQIESCQSENHKITQSGRTLSPTGALLPKRKNKTSHCRQPEGLCTMLHFAGAQGVELRGECATFSCYSKKEIKYALPILIALCLILLCSENLIPVFVSLSAHLFFFFAIPLYMRACVVCTCVQITNHHPSPASCLLP